MYSLRTLKKVFWLGLSTASTNGSENDMKASRINTYVRRWACERRTECTEYTEYEYSLFERVTLAKLSTLCYTKRERTEARA